MALNHFRANHFAARHFQVLRRAVEQPTQIGGGGGHGYGGRQDTLRVADRLKRLLYGEDVLPELVEVVEEAVEKTLVAVKSDELSTRPADEARQAVEQAWFDIQTKKVELETKLSLDEIKWLLTLQQELSMLYGIIDDEEAALVLLMST